MGTQGRPYLVEEQPRARDRTHLPVLHCARRAATEAVDSQKNCMLTSQGQMPSQLSSIHPNVHSGRTGSDP